MQQLKSRNYSLDAFCLLSALLCLMTGCSERNAELISNEPIQLKLVAEDSIQVVKNKKYKLTEYSILIANKSTYGMHYFNFYRDYHWPDNMNRSVIYFVVDEDGKKYPHCGYPSSTPAVVPEKNKIIEVGDTIKVYLTVAKRNDENILDVFKQRFCIKTNKRIFLQAFYIELLNINNAYNQIKNGDYKIIANSNLVSIDNKK